MLTEKSKIQHYLDLLNNLNNILNKTGYSFNLIEQKIKENSEKLKNEQIVVSVIGQFKRGKSSVINALLSDEILPVSVLPLTAIPVFIYYSQEIELQIKTKENVFSLKNIDDIKKGLINFATEKENPENKKGVLEIKLSYPSDILKNNIIIVDTPGIGSVYAHNTKTAEDVMPKSDIGIFIVSPDPPFTEVEMNYFKMVLPKIKTVFFVINKSDIVSDSDIKEVKDFYLKILDKIFDNEITKNIFTVSSRTKKGIDELKKAIMSYIDVKKTDILIDVSANRIKDIINMAKNEISLILNSLKMPLKKFEDNIKLFNECISKIDEKADMITGNILIRRNKIEEHLKDLLSNLENEIYEEFAAPFLNSAKSGSIDEKELEKVINRISERFEIRQKEIEKVIEERVLGVLYELKDDFEKPLKELKQKIIEFFNVDIEIPQEATEFKFIKKPYFVDKNFSFSYKLIKDNLFFRIMPEFFRKKKFNSYLKKDFDDIIMKNIDNIKWEFIQCIQDTFIKYEGYYFEKNNIIKDSILDSLEKVKNAISDFKQSKEDKIQFLSAIHDNILKLYGEI